MAGIQDLINKYTNILKALPEERTRIALIIGNDAKALTASRVQNEGINAEGAKMPLYSKRPLPLHYFTSPNQGATEKFKKDVRAKKTVPSYENFRKYHGYPIDKRTTTFTGDMWKDVFVEVTNQTMDMTEVTIRARSDMNQKKINYNSASAKTNILKISKEEAEMLNKAHAKLVEDFLKKYK